MHVRQLQRHRACDLAVDTIGQPDDAHTANAEFAHEAIDANDGAGVNMLIRKRFESRPFKEIRRQHCVCAVDDAAQPGALLGIARFLLNKPLLARGRGELQRFVEQSREVGPVVVRK